MAMEASAIIIKICDQLLGRPVAAARATDLALRFFPLLAQLLETHLSERVTLQVLSTVKTFVYQVGARAHPLVERPTARRSPNVPVCHTGPQPHPSSLRPSSRRTMCCAAICAGCSCRMRPPRSQSSASTRPPCSTCSFARTGKPPSGSPRHDCLFPTLFPTHCPSHATLWTPPAPNPARPKHHVHPEHGGS